ncbi:MAG: T9SS type A sorting domain-containing protein, partial [Candidatus Cloacimonadaceae bacterium]|nr:T9SS type A sorting domain-containing protein [Candidatus Cloacimonadaceae bacterium]
RWGSGIPVPPRIKEASESFIYDEKPDYIPVYLNIPDDMMMDLCEIGLYVDGVCKGAVVVDGPFEQVSAYVDSPDELSGDDVEFVFCYEEGKRAGNELRAMNLNPGRLQPQYGIAGASYPYFEIKLTQDDMDEIVPPEFSLKQNYPNPFNPSTTISYWLPETARVRLDIYNLKGQLVKTLIDSEMAAGLHSVVWNGKDSNNQAVASGVYFYRISSPNNTQTKRMLLMK